MLSLAVISQKARKKPQQCKDGSLSTKIKIGCMIWLQLPKQQVQAVLDAVSGNNTTRMLILITTPSITPPAFPKIDDSITQ